jgi:ribose transport system ATP-binding protein
MNSENNGIEMDKESIINAREVSKAFGPTRALINVDLKIGKGEVRGLIGENGSGKSTFAAILAGALKPDNGKFWISGNPFVPENMVQAQRKGISIIIQERGTIPGITVASNIFAGRLGQFTKFGFLNWKDINQRAQDILDEIGAGHIKADAMIDQYNFEDMKIVEVARAMIDSPQLLIADETTTALAQKGRTIIYQLIERMRNENKAVLFISHDLDELIEVCDTVTVLRDGQVIETLENERISIEEMRKLMVGRELEGNYFRADYQGSLTDDVILEAHQLTLHPFFENIDLELHRGEILGLGGLSNSGMHELGKTLYGIEKPITGHVKLVEKNTYVNNPSTASDNGMGYVSKDRDKEAILNNATIKSNIVLPSLKLLSQLLGFIPPASEKELSQKNIDKMSIKCRNESQLCKELSGGNKQKVVFSKWLAKDCDILILDCPTRGVDVGVKAEMYKLINELKNTGKAIVMISEELPELIGMSDRMLIFKDGEISKEIKRHKDIKEKDVINYMI